MSQRILCLATECDGPEGGIGIAVQMPEEIAPEAINCIAAAIVFYACKNGGDIATILERVRATKQMETTERVPEPTVIA